MPLRITIFLFFNVASTHITQIILFQNDTFHTSSVQLLHIKLLFLHQYETFLLINLHFIKQLRTFAHCNTIKN